MPAVEIVDSVWLVGSGTHPDALTDPHDCHCYLVWDGTGGLLVDTGTGLGADAWLANIAEVCDPAVLSGVVVTHYHADHAGGTAAARAAGLPVIASAETRTALAVADEARTSWPGPALPASTRPTTASLPRPSTGSSVAGTSSTRAAWTSRSSRRPATATVTSSYCSTAPGGASCSAETVCSLAGR
ncbi:MBL fold metallo-hydrolase [Micromonospora sp. Llam7]|nr:MBL fold metallo-hydrolase [Micromonospora tarapacensis]